MRKTFFLIGFALLLACGGQIADQPASDGNPFFAAYGTEFNVHPFDRIQPDQIVPAFEEGMKRQNAEVDVIVDNPEGPTFENTIVALDLSGELLDEVSRVFFALTGSNTNDQLQQIQKEMSPRLAAHRDEIRLNKGLFERVRTVYNRRADLDLSGEQLYLLENLYKRYVRAGALLDDEEQTRLKEINQRLSQLRVEFGQNLLAETNDFMLIIDDEADLTGLPDGVIDTAAGAAARAGHEGQWVSAGFLPRRFRLPVASTDLGGR